MRTYIRILLLLATSLYSIQVLSSVVISQIMYDTPSNELIIAPPYSNGEFIELYNMEEQSQDISKWALTGDGITERVTFPVGTVVPANGHLIVAYRHSKSPSYSIADYYNTTIDCNVFYQNKLVLSNSGEHIRLFDSHGMLMDSIFYDGTSNKRKQDRLSADNPDTIAPIQCRSIQRQLVAFYGNGRVVADNGHWTTSVVSFATCHPALTDYITEDFYWTASSGLPSNENYVVSVVPIDSCQQITFRNTGIVGQRGVRMSVNVGYVDALGRTTLTVNNAASPSKKDIVSYVDYDNDNRHIRQYLPYTQQGFLPQSMDGLPTAIAQQYADPVPYRTTQKEKSKQSRVLQELAPGESYQSHPSSYTYGVCGQDILRFVCLENGLATQGYYPEGTLQSITHSDADGKRTTSILDTEGNTLVLMMGNNNRTYYVYDDMGHLRYVLPPAITCQLNAQMNISDSADYMQQYAYIYKYDRYGNMVSKKFPGVDVQFMTYDRAGRLVRMQDGNQRARGDYWLQMQYDGYGRITSTSELTTTAGDTRPLIISTYDSYQELSSLSPSLSSWLRWQSDEDTPACIDNPIGLQTTSTIYHLSDSGYTTSAYYYDDMKRIVQLRSISTNGYKSVRNVSYNFDGSPKYEQVAYQVNEQLVTEDVWYTYDHAGRRLQEWCSINHQPKQLLVEYVYDDHGLLIEKRRHDQSDIIRYDYDLRQSPTLIASDVFTERLYYADSVPSNVARYYNGAIAAVSVTHGDSIYRFAYAYDGLNRLTQASRIIDQSLIVSEAYEYDCMGNILSLERNDLSGTPLDRLQYDYIGNQLMSVTDQVASPCQYDTKEYLDLADEPQSERLYDANGNMTYDADRNIEKIVYNLLNLPDSVIFADGSLIVNAYDATGRKLESNYLASVQKEMVPQALFGAIFDSTLVDSKRTIYWGDMELHYVQSYPDSLTLTNYVLHNSEGYMQWSVDSLGEESVNQYYLYLDHLGNTCAVWNATADTVVQRMCYYASGLPMNISTGLGEQPYLYNGKEFVEVHGYDVFDYGFRGYYAATGLFTSIDPLCGQTPWQSPYVYANNNPICNIDWMGLSASIYNSANYDHINFTVLDKDYNVIYHDDRDECVYLWLSDEEFNSKSFEERQLRFIGIELPSIRYVIGEPCLYLATYFYGNTHMPYSVGVLIMKGKNIATPSQLREEFPITSLIIDGVLLWTGEKEVSSLINCIRFIGGFFGAKSLGDIVSALSSIIPCKDIIVDLKNTYNKYLKETTERREEALMVEFYNEVMWPVHSAMDNFMINTVFSDFYNSFY